MSTLTKDRGQTFVMVLRTVSFYGALSSVLLVSLPGCGLISVTANVNGKPVGSNGTRRTVSADQTRKPAPSVAPETTNQKNNAPAAQYQWAQPASAGSDPRVPNYAMANQPATDPLADGRALSEALGALATQAKAVTAVDSMDVYFEITGLCTKIALGLVWYYSPEGTAFRNAVPVEERTKYDEYALAAEREGSRIGAMIAPPNSGSASASSPGNPASSATSYGSQDDSEQRRNACLSGCQRNCPSPYGAGDQWNATNQIYAQCMNEMSSCRSGCN